MIRVNMLDFQCKNNDLHDPPRNTFPQGSVSQRPCLTLRLKLKESRPTFLVRLLIPFP
jgi:hypothetical protein